MPQPFANLMTTHSLRWLALHLALAPALLVGQTNTQPPVDLPHDSGSTGADGPLIILENQPGLRQLESAYDPSSGNIVAFGGEVETYSTPHVTEEGMDYSDRTLQWSEHGLSRLDVAVHPTGRRAHGMATDPARGEVVLFGGDSADGLLNDTWVWKDGAWTQKNPANAPGPRSHFEMVYCDFSNDDEANGAVYLFGGFRGAGLFGDLWKWDGTDWQEVNDSGAPFPNTRYSMTFDSQRRFLLMYGGQGFQASTAMWAFRGDTLGWLQLRDDAAPARRELEMVYNEANQELLLFGDETGSDETYRWNWDTFQWNLIDTEIHPALRRQFSLVYSPASESILLFGGRSENELFEEDVWEWRDDQWTQLVDKQSVFDMRDRADGIYHFTDIQIPKYHKVFFQPNALNTPLTWLASGQARIDGWLVLNGGIAADYQDGAPGGPGGGRGGEGADFVSGSTRTGGQALGVFPGRPGGSADSGASRNGISGRYVDPTWEQEAGEAAFSHWLQPLVGGSGGGGGASTTTGAGGHGGGGGGALMVNATRDLVFNGLIEAKGGIGDLTFLSDKTTNGGLGSGGAVRLVADRISGSGHIDVRSADAFSANPGRVRLEAFELASEDMVVHPEGFQSSRPVETQFLGAGQFLRFLRIDDEDLPVAPTSRLETPDRTLPGPGAHTVVVGQADIEDGARVRLHLTGDGGFENGAFSDGVIDLGAATFELEIPAGVSTIQAFTEITYSPEEETD